MNESSSSSAKDSDQGKLPDAPKAAERVDVAQNPVPVSSLRASSHIPLPAPYLSSLYLPKGSPPTSTLNEVNALRPILPMASAPAGLAAMAAAAKQQLSDPTSLMAVAAAHQQSQLENASLLRSVMDQKLKLSIYEDQLRSRMLLPPSAPMFQARVLADPSLALLGAGSAQQAAAAARLPTHTLPAAHSVLRKDGRTMRGGVLEPFPEKLHRLLMEVEASGKADIISFIANGRAFAIHKPDAFFKDIMPKYFRQTRLSSFKRQLNLYGFDLINTGPARGGYFHKFFVKDRPEDCRRMRRVAVKVHASRDAVHAHLQPDFYTFLSSVANQKPASENSKSDSATESETTS